MYEELDRLIIKAVYESHKTPRYRHHVVEEARRIARVNRRSDFRVIDGRLKAMSRAGVIKYLRKKDAPGGNAGWYLGDGAGGGA